MLLNPPLLTLHEILHTPLPPVEWDCEPIIPHRRRIVVFGEFGALKSWILLDLSLHLALGIPWLSHPVPRPRRVLYIDEEMAEEDLRRRLHLLATGLTNCHPGVTVDTANFRAYSRVGVTFDQGGAAQLLAHLARAHFDPEVIMVEALIRVFRGNENFSVDVAAFWRHVEPLIRAGATVIVSHHMGKPNVEHPRPVRNRSRGSGEILAGSDVGWAIEEVTPGSVSQLTCVKTRSSRTPDPFQIRVADVAGGVQLSFPSPGQDRAQDNDGGDQGLSPLRALAFGPGGSGAAESRETRPPTRALPSSWR